MRATTLSTDEQLLDRLRTPPDLGEGVESLGYWRERRRQLPWYRVRARREAALMTARWEQRVRAALLSEHGTPVATRVSAGLLIVRIRLLRWTRRAVVALTAVVAVALVVAPAVAAAILLAQAF